MALERPVTQGGGGSDSHPVILANPQASFSTRGPREQEPLHTCCCIFVRHTSRGSQWRSLLRGKNPPAAADEGRPEVMLGRGSWCRVPPAARNRVRAAPPSNHRRGCESLASARPQHLCCSSQAIVVSLRGREKAFAGACAWGTALRAPPSCSMSLDSFGEDLLLRAQRYRFVPFPSQLRVRKSTSL
jgi:hypothetical protein